jgi:hypothetical protein
MKWKQRTVQQQNNAEFLSLQCHDFITKDPTAVPRWHSAVCQATTLWPKYIVCSKKSYILWETEGQKVTESDTETKPTLSECKL